MQKQIFLVAADSARRVPRDHNFSRTMLKIRYKYSYNIYPIIIPTN